MEMRPQVKNRRKMISPVFHTQTKSEDEKHLSKEVIKTVRRTGVLKLCGKHLAIGKHIVFDNFYSSRWNYLVLIILVM